MEWAFKGLNKLTGVNVRDVPAENFIASVSDYLKKSGKFKIPEWIDFIKSGPNRYLAPSDPVEWLFERASSLLRKLYLNKRGTGVGALRMQYGGKYERGCVHNITAKGSGKVIRYCLQQLEAMKLVEIVNIAIKEGDVETKTTAGRRLTKKAYQELDNIAKSLVKREK